MTDPEPQTLRRRQFLGWTVTGGGGLFLALLGGGVTFILGLIGGKTTASNPAPTELTIAAAPNPAELDEAIAITGTLTRARGRAARGVPDQTIILESSVDDATWEEVLRTVTVAEGVYSAQIRFNTTGRFFVRSRYPGGRYP